MKTRTVWTIVAVITVAFVLFVTTNETKANETQDNPIINTVETVKDKAINNKVTQFVIDEKNEIVDFQKESWQQSKDQLARNKETITGFWKALKGAVRFYTATQ
jgi:chemotaxis signal transduction protein